jgi:uncharacterized protein YqeY
MSMLEKLNEDMKSAMKSRDEFRLSTIRLVKSELKYDEIKKGHELSDQEIVEVIVRESKKRREALEGAEMAGRADLAEKAKAELSILQEYLPKQLGEEEIEQIVRDIMAEVGAAGPKDKGKLMGVLMPKVRGAADGKLVNQVVERLLQG